jgi:5-formyltetrahydrofolate cyclo-ligase
MITDNTELKMELREKARKLRHAFAVEAIAAGDKWQPGTLADWNAGGLALKRGVALASYRPVGSEANPAPLEERLLQSQAIIGFPRIDSDGAMRFYSLSPSGTFARNPLGFEEPADDTWPIEPTIILVPLLAFDRSGTRLGQGGGHYDRALISAEKDAAAKGRPLTKAGIAWSVQEMVDLPRDPWDVPLDIVITEREWIKVKR